MLFLNIYSIHLYLLTNKTPPHPMPSEWWISARRWLTANSLIPQAMSRSSFSFNSAFGQEKLCKSYESTLFEATLHPGKCPQACLPVHELPDFPLSVLLCWKFVLPRFSNKDIFCNSFFFSDLFKTEGKFLRGSCVPKVKLWYLGKEKNPSWI